MKIKRKNEKTFNLKDFIIHHLAALFAPPLEILIHLGRYFSVHPEYQHPCFIEKLSSVPLILQNPQMSHQSNDV
jgi:hypothetical protein